MRPQGEGRRNTESPNNSVWKGLLQAIWFKPLLKSGPILKTDQVAQS